MPPSTHEVPTLIARIAAFTPFNPREFERFIKFAIVGAIGAVVDFIVLNLMMTLFNTTGFAVGQKLVMGPLTLNDHQIQLICANAISFTVAVLSNFTWNRLWTFPESRQYPIRNQLPQFATVNIVGLILNTFILLVMDHYVFNRFFEEPLSYNLAKAVAIAVVLFWNFGINRIWTYRDIE